MSKLLNWLLPSRNIPLKDLLEVANEQLESARNATTNVKALLLCDSVKATLKSAENIAVKKVGSQNQNTEIANAYHKHGRLLEELGYHEKARKSYSKAGKWGGINAGVQNKSLSQYSNDIPLLQPFSSRPLALTSVTSISAVVVQGVTLDLNTTGLNCFEPISKKQNERTPQYIFGYDVPPPVSLSPPGLAKMDGNAKRKYSWPRDIRNRLDDQRQLRASSMEAVGTFAWDKLEITEEAEVVSPAAVPKQDEFKRLLQVFIEGIERSTLLEVHLVDGLVQIIRNCPQGNFDTDDLTKILSLLGRRLNTHQQFMQYTLRLAMAVSRALDSMVDSQVEGIDFLRLYKPLSDYLKRLQQSSNPCLVFQAAYAYQALQYIPDDESILKSMMRRTGRVTQGISGATTAAKSLELKRFIEGLQDTQDGLEGEAKLMAIIGKAYQNAEELAGSDHRFLECLQEDFSFSHKSAWYPALRGLDILLQEGRLTAFEELIRGAPCRHNLAFQWGACQRLGEIAANPVWDTVTRKGAVSLLGELYMDDSWWGKQIDVKKWILQILIELTKFAEGAVGDKAQMLLNGWEVDGDHETRLLYQVHMKEGQISRSLTFRLPPPCGFWLFDCAQEITESDVESRMCQLKRKRLGEIGGDVYIPLKAELNNAMGYFDLMSKVQEFLKSNDKVFLLLGDSGAGKSTFGRALEISLWREYKKETGRIPLFIHLSTIENPGQNLISERLRKANFTESQISELKENREFILICDGYDESQQTQNLYTSNQLNQPGEWRAQMIINRCTEYNGVDYKNRFQPTDRNNGGKLGLFQEAVIVPFNKNQIEDYVSQFVSWNKPSWETEDYLQALKNISGLRNLVTDIFLLRITLDLLPRLLETEIDSSTRITRVELYDEFVHQWIERHGIQHLWNECLTTCNQDPLVRFPDSSFIRQCISYMKELATAIYDNQAGNPVVKYSDHHDQQTWKAKFFDISFGNGFIRNSVPLTCSGSQYQFIHKSVLEYSLSLSVFDPKSTDNLSVPDIFSDLSTSDDLDVPDGQSVSGSTTRSRSIRSCRSNASSVKSYEDLHLKAKSDGFQIPSLSLKRERKKPVVIDDPPKEFSESGHSPSWLFRHVNSTAHAQRQPPRSLLDTPLGKRTLAYEPTILQFLVERAQKHPPFVKELLAVIEKSKTDMTHGNVSVAAANASTILERAGVHFIRDARRKTHTSRRASSSKAQMTEVQFHDSNPVIRWLANTSVSSFSSTSLPSAHVSDYSARKRRSVLGKIFKVAEI